MEVRYSSRNKHRTARLEIRKKVTEGGESFARGAGHKHFFESIERWNEDAESYHLKKSLVVEKMETESIDEFGDHDVVKCHECATAKADGNEEPTIFLLLVLPSLCTSDLVDERGLAFTRV